MAITPVWITVETALTVHQKQIIKHGGMPGIRDKTLLEAALARPEQLFAYEQPTPNLTRLAAAYGFSIVRNHPFVDGNKRTGLVAIRLFLARNGLTLHATSAEKVPVILATAAGDFSEAQLIDWIEQRTISRR